MESNILPECYIDTKLVKVLVPPRKYYNHQKGTWVLKKMDEELNDDFALGVVDEDVEDRPYAQHFQVVCEHDNCLKLLKHTTRSHYLIFLCPVIEKWIIGRAEDVGITLTSFGLPHDFDKLRKLSKTSKSESKDPYSENFLKLFRALRDANPPPVAVLKYWITYLKENSYQANLPQLIGETEALIG